MTDYLIVGNGIAGTTAAEKIRKQDKEGRITIVTDEDVPFYYRIRLNEYLSGEMAEEELVAKREDWYQRNDVTLKLNTKVQEVSPGKMPSSRATMKRSVMTSFCWLPGAIPLFLQ